MDFVFFCPNKQQTFETSEFRITDSRGVKINATGEKYLDAKVVLVSPCPFCGKHHEYKAAELSCPFDR